jgi:hypothetical protein
VPRASGGPGKRSVHLGGGAGTHVTISKASTATWTTSSLGRAVCSCRTPRACLERLGLRKASLQSTSKRRRSTTTRCRVFLVGCMAQRPVTRSPTRETRVDPRRPSCRCPVRQLPAAHRAMRRVAVRCSWMLWLNGWRRSRGACRIVTGRREAVATTLSQLARTALVVVDGQSLD